MNFNATSRAFSRGRVQGYDAGFKGGVSFAIKALQLQSDASRAPARKALIDKIIEGVVSMDVERVEPMEPKK